MPQIIFYSNINDLPGPSSSLQNLALCVYHSLRLHTHDPQERWLDIKASGLCLSEVYGEVV